MSRPVSDESHYFTASAVQPDFFGTPFPTPGVRVRFDPAAIAAFGKPRTWPAPMYAPHTRHGLLVYTDPRATMTWPCRLWRVHRLENTFSPPEVGTLPWLRCDSFEVVEELPAWRVFGPHGAAVADFIAEVEHIDQAQVDILAAMDSEHEGEVRLKFLERWRRQQPAQSGVYEPSGAAGWHVDTAVNLAAGRTGQHLFDWIETAASWPILADPSWRNAALAAQATLNAVSAPELLDSREIQVLTARWSAIR